MECKDISEVLSNMKVEIKQEDDWQDETATEPTYKTGLTLDLVLPLRIKKETVSEETGVEEHLLSSILPRLTSAEVSQDGSGTCTSLTHSDSRGCCQMEVISDFKTTIISAILAKNVDIRSSVRQNKCPFNCNTSDTCEHHSKSFGSPSALETVSEVTGLDEDILSSILPRWTSEEASQDGSATCTFIAHSNSKGCCQMGEVEVVSEFKTTSVSAVLAKNVDNKSSMRQNKCPFNCNPSHACDHHSKSFLSPSALVRNEWHYWDNNNSYECNVCGKSFRSSSCLRKHFVIHSDVKQHKCQICEKTFKRKADLNQHILSLSATKTYNCDRCGKYYQSKSGLWKHTQILSCKEPCVFDICHQSFIHKSLIIQHMWSHSDTKQYKCDRCEKSYKSKSGLWKHTQIRSCKEPYEFDLCHKSFIDKSLL